MDHVETKVIKIYPYLVKPENYADFLEKSARAVTREDLNNKVQFTTLRMFSENEKGELISYKDELTLYTEELKLGNAIWPHSKQLFAPNFHDVIDEIAKRGLYVFDIWEYWPGVYGDSFEWGTATEYICPPETFKYIRQKLGNRFLGLSLGELDGNYIINYAPNMCFPIQGREEQYNHFHEHFTEMWNDIYHNASILCAANWCHYFAKEGNVIIIGPETAQAFMNVNLWYAFMRGAGKQYGLLWFGNIASYNRWGHKTYDSEGRYEGEGLTWTEYGSDAGTSLNLMRRLLYTLFIYNSVVLGFELGHIYTDGESKNKLTPIGKMQSDAIAFVETLDPGTMYTPVAILMDFHNGWMPPKSFWHSGKNKFWGNMPYEHGDYQIHALFDLLFPGYEDSGFFRDERGFLTPTPYSDMTDILLSDVRSEVLNTYNLVVLAGEIKLDAELCDKLVEFIENGGHVILTIGQIKYGYDRLTACIPGLKPKGDEVPPVLEVTFKTGKISLITSQYGMDSDHLLPVVKEYIGGCLNMQKIIDINNEKLQYSVNLLDDGSLLLTVVNNFADTENFEIRTNALKSIEEINIPQISKDTKGYYAEGKSIPDRGMVRKDRYNIGPLDIKFYKIKVLDVRFEKKPEITVKDRRENFYISLRKISSVREEILSKPTLSYNFSGVKLDAEYFISRDTAALEKEAAYLKRQNIDVIVDFRSMINHFPGISLLDVKTKRYNEFSRYNNSLETINSVFSKTGLFGCGKAVISLHANAPGLKLSKAVDLLRISIKEICISAGVHGVTVYLQNSGADALLAEMGDLIEFINNLNIDNLKFILNTCNTIAANVEHNDEIMKKVMHRTDALLVSTPRRDRFGQKFFSHDRVSGSEFADRITDICKEKRSSVDFICLDGVYTDWSEMYLDKKVIR